MELATSAQSLKQCTGLGSQPVWDWPRDRCESGGTLTTQATLAYLFYEGIGVEKSASQAEFWMKQAENGGLAIDADTQSFLEQVGAA